MNFLCKPCIRIYLFCIKNMTWFFFSFFFQRALNAFFGDSQDLKQVPSKTEEKEKTPSQSSVVRLESETSLLIYNL